ncbi:MAG TPA: hypothetical protein VF980_02580 [Thermoanaerobaculia bacterium]
MRRLTVLAMIVAVLVAGSAFAQRHLTIQPNATFANGLAPSTTNNDDSCDIGTYPAATLLLPFFQVDLGTAGTGRTVLFDITNTSRYSQIAHVTVWTDWSVPVLDFNLFLTGYDVVPVNLFDVIARGLIPTTSVATTAQPGATNTAANTSNVNVGTKPVLTTTLNGGNPNFSAAVPANCAAGRLPGQLPPAAVADIRAALSTGTATGTTAVCPGTQVGSNHGANTAVGYVTIDVNADCNTSLPTSPAYFTTFILFDNVLTGDYFDVNQNTATGNFAGGNPMVHIRAIPEGGAAGSVPGTNLPFTFYDRYTLGANTRTVDRRQPLPSTFAARWISGTAAIFDTQYKIWREGLTGAGAACVDFVANDTIPLTEIVRFDERENAAVVSGGQTFSPFTPSQPSTRETELVAVATGAIFPQIITTDAGGWMYMNLNNGGDLQAGSTTLYSAARPGFGSLATTRDVSQNWVIVQMFAEGRFGVDFDATQLGNGCNPAAAGSDVAPIGPAGGALIGTLSNNFAATAGCAVCTPNGAATNTTP